MDHRTAESQHFTHIQPYCDMSGMPLSNSSVPHKPFNTAQVGKNTAPISEPIMRVQPGSDDLDLFAEIARSSFKNEADAHNQDILANARRVFKFPIPSDDTELSNKLKIYKGDVFANLLTSSNNDNLAPEIRFAIKTLIQTLNEKLAFSNMVLKDKDLSNQKQCNLILVNVVIENCNFSNFIGPGLTIINGKLKNVSFDNSVLDHSYINSVMNKVTMNNASLQHSEFNSVTATELALRKADLNSSDIINGWFTRCDFDGSNLPEVKIIGGSLINCNFNGTYFYGTKIKDTALHGNSPKISSSKVLPEYTDKTHPHLATTRIKSDINSPFLVSDKGKPTPADRELELTYKKGFNIKESRSKDDDKRALRLEGGWL